MPISSTARTMGIEQLRVQSLGDSVAARGKRLWRLLTGISSSQRRACDDTAAHPTFESEQEIRTVRGEFDDCTPGTMYHESRLDDPEWSCTRRACGPGNHRGHYV